VGKILYALKTRPEILYATNLASRYMHVPQSLHLAAAEGILHYLSRFSSLGLFYRAGEESILRGYSDANFAADLDDRFSTGASSSIKLHE
jgi:hypothetical protein